MGVKWKTLLMLSLAELLAMSLWFSATAVAPALVREWRLDAAQAAWLTMAVQVGFVVGALLSATFNLPDLVLPRRVLAVGAILGALLNALLPHVEGSLASAVALRFGTGLALAAVYPVGMKIMATWTREDRGLALGLLVGALTVGSASPHLIRALGGTLRWEPVVYATSVLALVGAALGWRFGRLGPYAGPSPRFEWRQMSRALRDPALRLANLGYLGHMWELYAMWTWIALFLAQVYAAPAADVASAQPGAGGAEALLTSRAETWAAAATFLVISAGGVGSLLAGRLADRWGRTRTTMLSMATSGGCALAIGHLQDAPAALVTGIALVWGFAIVADSAQFSTAVTELAGRDYMGTLLTTQTCMGFALTLISIRLVPELVERAGWTAAFTVLAVGPLVGTGAMWLLGRSPAAGKLAGGRG